MYMFVSFGIPEVDSLYWIQPIYGYISIEMCRTSRGSSKRQESLRKLDFLIPYDPCMVCIYLQFVHFYGKCREIYHTWILWVIDGYKILRFSTGNVVRHWRSAKNPAGQDVGCRHSSTPNVHMEVWPTSKGIDIKERLLENSSNRMCFWLLPCGTWGKPTRFWLCAKKNTLQVCHLHAVGRVWQCQVWICPSIWGDSLEVTDFFR